MQVYNFDVTAYLYTKDDVERIYFIAKSDNADQLTYAYGSDPYAEPVVEDVVLKENYQADGTGFSFTTPIDWETQKFQAVLDVTGCSTSAVEDIFGLGPDVSSFANNIHVYSEQNSTFKAYYQCSNGNNNTTVSIADKQNVTIEVSKAEGLTVDGNVIIPAANLHQRSLQEHQTHQPQQEGRAGIRNLHSSCYVYIRKHGRGDSGRKAFRRGSGNPAL